MATRTVIAFTLNTLHRACLIAVSVVALEITLVWVIEPARIVVESAPIQLLFPLVAHYEIWLWGVIAVLASVISILLATRSFDDATKIRLSWGCALLALWISILFFLRSFLIEESFVGSDIVVFLDLIAVCSATTSPWLFCRLFWFFPTKITRPIWTQLTNRRYEEQSSKWWRARLFGIETNRTIKLAVAFGMARAWVSYYFLFLVLSLGLYVTLRSHWVGYMGFFLDGWSFTLGVLWFSLCITWYISPFFFLDYQYELANPNQKKHLRWLFVGRWMAIWTVFPLWGLALAGYVSNSTLLAWFILLFLVSLSLSMFGKGVFEPTLALGRSAFAGALGTIFMALYICIQELLETEAIRQFNLPDEVAALGAAALMSLTYTRVKEKIEKPINRLFAARYQVQDGTPNEPPEISKH